MNGTGGLFRKSLEFVWRHPVVFVPVLLLRLADFAVYWICGLLKGPAVKAVAPRSVLGGFSGRVSTPVVLTAAFLTFLPLVIEVALLVYGMAVTGRWAHALREAHAEDRSWKAPGAEVARVSLLTLCVGAVTAAAGLYFTLHGGVPVRWAYLVTWCFLLVATWFVLPSWLRLLATAEAVRFRDPPKLPPFLAMALSFAVFAACVYLGGIVQRSLEAAHKSHGLVTPFLVNLVAVLLSAFPLTVGFVAMSRYVADRPGWQSE